MRSSRTSSAAPRLPDAGGHFGVFGGRYVAETLMPALLELERAYLRLRRDARFKRELAGLLTGYAHSPLIPSAEKSGVAVFKKPVIIQELVEFLEAEIR